MRVVSSPPESFGCLIPCPAPRYPHPQGLFLLSNPSSFFHRAARLSQTTALKSSSTPLPGDLAICLWRSCPLLTSKPSIRPLFSSPHAHPLARWLECHWEDVQKDTSDDADLLAQLATLDSDEDASEEEDDEDDDDCSQNEESNEEVKESGGKEDSAETEEAESPGLDDLDFIQFDAPTRQREAEEEDDDDELVMSVVPRSIPHKRAAPCVAERSEKKKKKLRQSPSQKKQT